MPRPRSQSTTTLLDGALLRLWRHGYEGSSMSDLLQATGSNRHSLYAEFRNKAELFLGVLKHYNSTVVDPAFSPVEAADADMRTIEAYFLEQIARAEELGLPGPGCLIANSMTELAPHDEQVRALVDAHNKRLRRGFQRALTNSIVAANRSNGPDTTQRAKALAEALVVFTQGLWSESRICSDAKALRARVATQLQLIEKSCQ